MNEILICYGCLQMSELSQSDSMSDCCLKWDDRIKSTNKMQILSDLSN